MIPRDEVAQIQYRNGAWLITWMGEIGHSIDPPDPDCAGTRSMAKRVAARVATDFGFTDHRWECKTRTWYVLSGVAA